MIPLYADDITVDLCRNCTESCGNGKVQTGQISGWNVEVGPVHEVSL